MTEAQPAAAPAAAPAATEVPAPQTFKVFAGNLAFATTDETLKEFFSTAGEVADAHVVTRANRSVGYGFVDYHTLELAEKAVRDLDKQTLDGRTINVELARAREEGTPAEGGEGAERGGRRRGRGRGRGRGGFRGPAGAPAAGGAPASAAGGAPAPYQQQGGYHRGYRGGNYNYEGQQQQQPQGGYYGAPYYEGGAYAYYPYQGPARGGRAPRPGRRARQQEGDEEQPAEQRGEEVARHEGGEGERGGRRRGRGGIRRGGRGGRSERPEGAPAGEFTPPAGDAPSGEFRGRGRRRGRGGRRFERKPRDENQVPSETTLFIANLPYDLDEEGLMAVFSDYHPKQARIARARGRSKGFGFIQLETQELQMKAAAEIDNTEVQGRILNVKPAVVDLSVEPEVEPEAAQDVAQTSTQQ